MKYLKYIRIFFALIIFVPILLFFLDFTGKVPARFHHVAEVQWVPAILSASIVILVILLLLSLLFGRIYCSVLCPLGVFQDIVSWKSRLFRSKKRKGYPSFTPAQSILRYTILALVVTGLLAGSSFLLMLLDPYSVFGRMMSQLFRPIVLEVNNLLADFLGSKGNYMLFRVNQSGFVPVVFAISFSFFVIISVMAWLRGRLFCNTICPVGTFLGLLSRFSVFRIKINESSCVKCGLCEKKCKSQCIDLKKMEVDHSRCVTCFDCISACKKSSMTYGLRHKQTNEASVSPENKNRRTFLISTGIAVSGAVAARAGQIKSNNDPFYTRKPVMPPGAINSESFHDKCTACQLCVTKCPMQVIKPASMQYGISGIMQPHLQFSTHEYCTYECSICSNVCPTGALKPLSVEEKKLTRVGVAVLQLSRCVVIADETDCGACSEHCPTQAVHMVDYKDGLTKPEVTADICIGCGACESICPAKPVQAIYVVGVDVQKRAKKPAEAPAFDKKVEDFGF